jgi:hypothetical protein
MSVLLGHEISKLEYDGLFTEVNRRRFVLFCDLFRIHEYRQLFFVKLEMDLCV